MHYKLQNAINTHRDFYQQLSEEKWLVTNVVAWSAGIYSLYRSQQKQRGFVSSLLHAFVAYNLVGNIPTIKDQLAWASGVKEREAILASLEEDEEAYLRALEEDRVADLDVGRFMANPVEAKPVKDGEHLYSGLGYPYEVR